jgi:hypothetical protein
MNWGIVLLVVHNYCKSQIKQGGNFSMIQKRMRQPVAWLLLTLLVALLSACSGQGNKGSVNTAPPTPTPTIATAKLSSTPTSISQSPTQTGTANPATPTSVTWKPFSVAAQFAINYPSDWKLQSNEPAWYFTSPSSQPQAVTVYRVDSPSSDITTAIYEAVRYLYGSGCQPGSTENVTINNNQYLKMVPQNCVGTSIPNNQAVYLHVDQKSSADFAIGCMAEADIYTTYDKTYCQPMLNSLKFLA